MIDYVYVTLIINVFLLLIEINLFLFMKALIIFYYFFIHYVIIFIIF